MVGNNFGQFGLNVLGIGRLSTEGAERFDGLLDLASLDVVPWRFGKAGNSDSQNQGPKELNPDWDTVCPRVKAILGGVTDDRCQK